MQEILKQIEKTRTLTAQRDELLRKLEHSALIQSLWHEAFAHGTAQTRLTGNLFRPDEMRFEIEDGAGEIKSFLLSDVPKKLRDDFLARLDLPLRAKVFFRQLDIERESK